MRPAVIAILVGVLVLAAIIVTAIVVSSRAGSNADTGNTRSGYTSMRTPEQARLVGILVNEVAPKVAGTRFNKMEIDRMVAEEGKPAPKDFDQVMYFHFRKQLSDGTLSEENLLRAIGTGDL